MMKSSTSRLFLRLLGLLGFLAVILSPIPLHTQDIAGFSVKATNDIFWRETKNALSITPMLANMPFLDCSIEYLRRFEGRDIVHRRGPIPLHQRGPMHFGSGEMEGARPVSESELLRKNFFIGGLLIDLPKAGEVADFISTASDQYRYMVRAVVIPASYNDNILSATIFLERALVSVENNVAEIVQSEVFSRSIELKGNEPLKFDLPPWESTEAYKTGVIPADLQEALLLTLETPRHFGFSKNHPEPFSEGTSISYAVPSSCIVKLSIQAKDRIHEIDEGQREPGIYEVYWDGENVEDGQYIARLSASDARGNILFQGSLPVTKDKNAQAFESRYSSYQFFSEHFIIGSESGLALQFPKDRVKPFRHMFTHVAVRFGYRISNEVEAGILAGQDAFHEYPGPNVDIERISEFGGVVPYTYGYIGPYMRWAPGAGTIKPLVQCAFAFSDAAKIVEVGVGIKATLFSKIDLFLMPNFMAHLKKTISKKVGINYGFTVRF